MASKVAQIFIGNRNDAAFGEIESIRVKVKEKKTELASLNVLPPHPDDLVAKASSELKAMFAGADAEFEKRLESCTIENFSVLPLRWSRDDTTEWGNFWVRVLPRDLILKATEENIRRVARKDVPREPERSSRITKLEREIFELETREEYLTVQLEQSGVVIQRRADLDPAVFLEWTE